MLSNCDVIRQGVLSECPIAWCSCVDGDAFMFIDINAWYVYYDASPVASSSFLQPSSKTPCYAFAYQVYPFICTVLGGTAVSLAKSSSWDRGGVSLSTICFVLQTHSSSLPSPTFKGVFSICTCLILLGIFRHPVPCLLVEVCPVVPERVCNTRLYCVLWLWCRQNSSDQSYDFLDLVRRLPFV